MAKPVLFTLKGSGIVEVSEQNREEYLEAVKAGNDLIKVCVKTSAFNIFVIKRTKLEVVDQSFIVSGGFEISPQQDSGKFLVTIDGVVSTELLRKKDVEMIASGGAICTLDHVGTRDNWHFKGECGKDELKISLPADKQ